MPSNEVKNIEPPKFIDRSVEVSLSEFLSDAGREAMACRHEFLVTDYGEPTIFACEACCQVFDGATAFGMSSKSKSRATADPRALTALSSYREAERMKVLQDARSQGYIGVDPGITLSITYDPSRKSREIAARIWQDQDMTAVAMDTNAATLIAGILDTVQGVRGDVVPYGHSKFRHLYREWLAAKESGVATPTVVE